MTMRRISIAVAGMVLVTILGLVALNQRVHAQGSGVLQISGAYSAHTACTITASQTTICLASDGLWLSLNGAAFTQVGAVAPTTPGVLSFNGQTGAVVYAAPVLSVNGKTGAVVVTATTSLN